MDTNRLKKFATEARTKLKAGIAAKIITLGFDKNGNVREENKPQLMQGGSLWNGQLQTEGFYYQWMFLYNRVQQKGVNEVYEEAAYTWFNRLMAIRILQKNDLCAPVLDFVDESRTPFIVDEARQGHLPQMKEDVRVRLLDLLDDDTKVTEQFAVLITAWCHDNPIINSCFGSMGDYTELLLPDNLLSKGSVVDKMVNDIIYNDQLMKDVYDILKKMSVDIEPLQEESHKLYDECRKLENEEYINNINKENNIQREKDEKNFDKNNWVVCCRKNNGPWKYRGIPVYIQSFYSNESEANDNKYMCNRRSSNKVYYSCNVNKLKINEL